MTQASAETSRRSFLGSAAVAAAATSTLTATSAKASSPAEKVVVGVMGVSRGAALAQIYASLPDVEVKYVCDTDRNRLNLFRETLAGKVSYEVKAVTDFRNILDDADVDALVCAAPNHWHAPASILACSAGKHAYVEKPCCHNPREGELLIEAARKNNRCVQMGNQRRSGAKLAEAMKLLHEGTIGRVYYSRSWYAATRGSIGTGTPAEVPPHIDYELWQGPAPRQPYTSNRLHYNWHWNWDYGNGDIGNQGIHEMDIARWGLGVTLPTRVMSMGSHYMFDDDQQTPNTQVATLEYDRKGKKVMLVFEVRHWMTNNEGGVGQRKDENGLVTDSNCIGNIFYGSEGYMAIDGYTSYKTFLGKKQEPGPSRREGGSTWVNFIQAVRSRKREELVAEIEEGHRSSAAMHLANISYRTGRSLNFNANSRQITGDAEANAMLRRKYRVPFVVPEKV